MATTKRNYEDLELEELLKGLQEQDSLTFVPTEVVTKAIEDCLNDRRMLKAAYLALHPMPNTAHKIAQWLNGHEVDL